MSICGKQVESPKKKKGFCQHCVNHSGNLGIRVFVTDEDGEDDRCNESRD